MKRTILLFIAVAFFVCGQTEGKTGGNFGLGLVLGEPTGLTGKLWTSRTRAWSGDLAFGLSHHHDYYQDDAVYLNVMHLWHDFNLAPVSSGELPFYFGVGGRLWTAHQFGLGVRGCGGLSYLPPRSPVDFFLEIGIVFDIVEDPGLDGDMGLGFRYYF